MFGIAFGMILIRSCYRVAELSHGFDGKFANQEIPFMILEGGMMLFCTILMTIWHPGRFMAAEWKRIKDVADERKFSIDSGRTVYGGGYYPNARRGAHPSSDGSFQPSQSSWPSHGAMHQVPLQ